ncbi:unnamed protein product, partial [Prorocentrum cordatum]
LEPRAAAGAANSAATPAAMSFSSLFDSPHPLVPLGKFEVAEGGPPLPRALEGERPPVGGSLLARGEVSTYALFPQEDPGGAALRDAAAGEDHLQAPDFLGRLHHLKTLFRMPVSQ